MNYYVVGFVGLLIALIVAVVLIRLLLSRSHIPLNLPSFEHNPQVWVQYVMEGLEEVPYHTARKAQHPGRDGTTYLR